MGDWVEPNLGKELLRVSIGRLFFLLGDEFEKAGVTPVDHRKRIWVQMEGGSIVFYAEAEKGAAA